MSQLTRQNGRVALILGILETILLALDNRHMSQTGLADLVVVILQPLVTSGSFSSASLYRCPILICHSS